MPDFRITPLVPPPDGVSNFVDPVTRAPMAIAVSSVVLALAVFVTLGRLYARAFVMRSMSADDWVGLAGMVFTAEYTIYSIVLFTLPGMGPHMWDIPGIVFFDPKFGLRLLFTEIMYCPSAYLIKLSIFLLYRRLFAAPGGKAKHYITGGLYISTLLYLVLFILSFAFCTKSTSVVDGGDCQTKGAYVTWALAAVNLVTDLYLLAIPLFVIAKLQLSTQRKFAVAAVFLFSIGATIASIISVYYRVYVSKHTEDFSWTIIPTAVATIAELNLGVICSSLPALNVIFRKRRIHQQTGYVSYGAGTVPKSNNGRSISRLLPRLSNRPRSNNSTGNRSNAALSHDTSTERDIVKLVDISQYSVPAEGKPSSQYDLPHQDMHQDRF